MRPVPLAAVLSALSAVPVLSASLHAQGQQRPASWLVRFDDPKAVDSTLVFVTMAPGWHVTTGPAGILYDPARTATGNYKVQSTVFVFGDSHLEGIGILIGGRDLSHAGQSYTYFLIRKDGRFLVKKRQGKSTTELVPWTVNAAIVKPADAKSSGENSLLVEVGTQAVTFSVNGTQVASLPRAKVDTDGIVGLRVNHHVNAHVSTLTVEEGT